jgi:hypothetical protein
MDVVEHFIYAKIPLLIVRFRILTLNLTVEFLAENLAVVVEGFHSVF